MLSPGRSASDKVCRPSALVVALAVFITAGAALSVAHHSPRLLVPKPAAIRAVLHDQRAASELHGVRWNSVSVAPVDGSLERVSFFDGAKIQFEAAVDKTRTVTHGYDFTKTAVPYGNSLAYSPAVLIGLAALFVAVAAVTPVLRVRNLDVVALLSFVAPVIMLKQRLIDESVLAASPGLGYLLARCAWMGLSRPGPRPDSTPLYLHLTRKWTNPERVRLLRMLVVAVVLVFAMVGVSSTGPVDVVFAVMEGATKLVHGVLPYGHMPGDIVHGDTYPVLSYVVYAPLASAAPVGSTWDSVDIALGATVLAALAVAGAAFRTAAGPRRHRARRRSPDAEVAGLRAALTWLCFPPLLIIVSTGTSDVVLAALIAGALVLWRRPGASTGVLAAAGWFKLAPFALLPLWLAPLRGRQVRSALGAVALVSAAVVALLVAVGGIPGPGDMLHAIGYQFHRASPQSLWTALGIPELQPLGQAAVLALIAVAAARLRADADLGADPARIAALAGAILLGLQLAADYWAFLYLAWVVPLVGQSLLAEDAALQLAPNAVAGRPWPVRKLRSAAAG
jgi:hypothetical protein